jgi:hypothetical protein
VQELDKKPGVPCKHICEKGCAIYGEHPEGCQSFVCTWYQGEHSQREKPCVTGIVCWVAYTGIMLDKDGNKCPTLFVSHRPNRRLSKKMRRWMIMQSYRFPVILTPMKGNNPRERTIWWQGKMVCDQMEVKQWYEEEK